MGLKPSSGPCSSPSERVAAASQEIQHLLAVRRLLPASHGNGASWSCVGRPWPAAHPAPQSSPPPVSSGHRHVGGSQPTTPGAVLAALRGCVGKGVETQPTTVLTTRKPAGRGQGTPRDRGPPCDHRTGTQARGEGGAGQSPGGQLMGRVHADGQRIPHVCGEHWAEKRALSRTRGQRPGGHISQPDRATPRVQHGCATGAHQDARPRGAVSAWEWGLPGEESWPCRPGRRGLWLWGRQALRAVCRAPGLLAPPRSTCASPCVSTATPRGPYLMQLPASVWV